MGVVLAAAGGGCHRAATAPDVLAGSYQMRVDVSGSQYLATASYTGSVTFLSRTSEALEATFNVPSIVAGNRTLAWDTDSYSLIEQGALVRLSVRFTPPGRCSVVIASAGGVADVSGSTTVCLLIRAL